MFADDIKIFLAVNRQKKCGSTTRTSNYLPSVVRLQNITLNTDKCQITTFSTAHLVTNFNYNIDDEILLLSIRPIKDLDVFFDSKFKFDCRVSQ